MPSRLNNELTLLMVFAALGVPSCGENSDPTQGDEVSSAGTGGSGMSGGAGANANAAGGQKTEGSTGETGGASAGLGGTSALPSATGGMSGGGAFGSSGGGVPIGGSGVTSTGGSSTSGGTSTTSVYFPATGGLPTSGGSTTGGGPSNSGGSPATGGAFTGGLNATGGALASGGTPSTGGAATGGAATGGEATGGAATGGTVATGGTTSTGGSTSSLFYALGAGTHAIFYLSGTAQFSYATYKHGSTSYPTQTAINFEIGRVSPIRFYLTDNGVKALTTEYFLPVTTQIKADGSVSLSYVWNATRSYESFSGVVKDSSISVQHLFVRSLDDGTTTGTTVSSQSEFTASLSMVAEAYWVPPPPYSWSIAPLSGTHSGVVLGWKDDLAAASLKEYRVYRNNQLIATVSNPTYADAVGLTCDILGFCSATYKVIAVSTTGALSAGAQLTCTWGTYTSLSCTADYAG